MNQLYLLGLKQQRSSIFTHHSFFFSTNARTDLLAKWLRRQALFLQTKQINFEMKKKIIFLFAFVVYLEFYVRQIVFLKWEKNMRTDGRLEMKSHEWKGEKHTHSCVDHLTSTDQVHLNVKCFVACIVSYVAVCCYCFISCTQIIRMSTPQKRHLNTEKFLIRSDPIRFSSYSIGRKIHLLSNTHTGPTE